MDYARDRHGKIVAAEGAAEGRSYVCPRPECGGRVFLRDGVERRAHFAHHPGEGSEACDEYHPSVGAEHLKHARSSQSGVEDSPRELGLIVDQNDGEWRLGLRLPEIPREELGETSLSALRQARVEVSVGTIVVSGISAIDLRSGVGAARVPVYPTVQQYAARTVGAWPSVIDRKRWNLAAGGVDARGTLFRLRRGEWTRLRPGAGVHQGEELVLLGVTRPRFPTISELPTRFAIGGDSSWTYWEVQIPDQPTPAAIDWLQRLGHTLIPSPWSVELATPPRARGASGEPIFWTGDAPVLLVETSQAGAGAPVWFRAGTNSLNVTARTSDDGEAFVAVKSQHVGTTQVIAGAVREAELSIAFVHRPTRAALLEQLTQTPRLRVWVGELAIEAWSNSTSKIPVNGALPEVRVDLGAEDARASVTIWEGRKQRSSRGLSARDVAQVIAAAAALPGTSRIELDANNFGRVELIPTRAPVERRGRSATSDRLAWFDHVASLSTPSERHATTTLLVRPRTLRSITMRRVGAPALVRSRLVLRRQREAGGNR